MALSAHRPYTTRTSSLSWTSSDANLGESLGAPRCVALFDGDVPALYVSQLQKPLPEGCDPAPVAVLPLQRQISDPDDLLWRLRVGAERPSEHGEHKGESHETHQLSRAFSGERSTAKTFTENARIQCAEHANQRRAKLVRSIRELGFAPNASLDDLVLAEAAPQSDS